jgi:hypothetical protein
MLSLVAAAALSATVIGADQRVYDVGVAEIDITPGYPIRLNGFGFRRTESEGVTQPIWAKAIAIGSDDEIPLILHCRSTAADNAPRNGAACPDRTR